MPSPFRPLSHCDPGNWKLGIFYFCRADHRVLVPKRVPGFGWTLNFARPMALPFLGFILATIYGIADLSTSFSPGGDPRSAVILLQSLTILALGYCLIARHFRKDQ